MVTGWAPACGNLTVMKIMPRGYSANHHRVYRKSGAARNYPCANDCNRQATQWAHTHDTDPAEPDNYRPMCRGCHAKYDGAVPPSRLGVKPANAKLSDDQAEEIRRLVASGVSQSEVARQYGCVKQVVWRIVHGTAYNRGVRSERWNYRLGPLRYVGGAGAVHPVLQVNPACGMPERR